MESLKKRVDKVSESIDQNYDFYRFLYKIVEIQLDGEVIKEMTVEKHDEFRGEIFEFNMEGFIRDIAKEKEPYTVVIHNHGIDDDMEFINKYKEEIKALYRFLMKNGLSEAVYRKKSN